MLANLNELINKITFRKVICKKIKRETTLCEREQ